MAPTIYNGVEQQTVILDFKDSDAQSLTPSAESIVQRAHVLHRQRSMPKLWRRRSQAETAPPNAVHNDDNEPYTSPIPLHAKIIPSESTMTTSQSTALMVVVAGVAALVIMRSIIIKKIRRLLLCGYGRRQAKKSKPAAEDKGALVNGDELDDPAWGTPPRLVYVEGLDDRLEKRHSTGPFSSPDSLSLPAVLRTKSTSPRSSAAYEDDSFRNRLEYEEYDITLALTRALRDSTDELGLNGISVCSIPSRDEKAGNVLTEGIFPSSNRPRQCSDASTSSQTITAAHSESTDFSVPSSDSSMTSLESTNSSLDEAPEEMEVVYEVRRAHAQSLELKKGVLVTCRRTSSTPDIATPGMLPTFLISEAPPSLMPLDDLNFAPLFSLSNSTSSKASLSGCTTTPSWSSIVRETSRGTMTSLSSSSTTTVDEWIRDDEQHLRPPIPFLMLTRPSDSSIYTAESFTSSVSVDLCDFPLPPISAKQPYYSKLVDQVQRAPKRIWDNHFADSSVAQKRSTVERFIMMYSSAM